MIVTSLVHMDFNGNKGNGRPNEVANLPILHIEHTNSYDKIVLTVDFPGIINTGWCFFLFAVDIFCCLVSFR